MQLYKALLCSNRKCVVFLDEPELSMSLLWKKELIEILKKYAKYSKIIVASQQIQIDKEQDLNLLIPILSR